MARRNMCKIIQYCTLSYFLSKSKPKKQGRVHLQNMSQILRDKIIPSTDKEQTQTKANVVFYCKYSLTLGPWAKSY